MDYMISGVIGFVLGVYLAFYIQHVEYEEGVIGALTYEKLGSYIVAMGICMMMGSMIFYHVYGYSLAYVMSISFLTLAFVLSWMDWQHMILPTRIIQFGLLIGVALKGVEVIFYGEWHRMVEGFLGALIGYGLFSILFYSSQWILKKPGLGYGDVRLMALVGFYIGIGQIMQAMMIGTVLAAGYGMIRWIGIKESKPYPLGPFLNIGGLCILIGSAYSWL